MTHTTPRSNLNTLAYTTKKERHVTIETFPAYQVRMREEYTRELFYTVALLALMFGTLLLTHCK